MANLSINTTRAMHTSYGGDKAFMLLLRMEKNVMWGTCLRKYDNLHQEWLTWTEFPADMLDGCLATLAHIGVPKTAIKTRTEKPAVTV